MTYLRLSDNTTNHPDMSIYPVDTVVCGGGVGCGEGLGGVNEGGLLLGDTV